MITKNVEEGSIRFTLWGSSIVFVCSAFVCCDKSLSLLKIKVSMKWSQCFSMCHFHLLGCFMSSKNVLFASFCILFCPKTNSIWKRVLLVALNGCYVELEKCITLVLVTSRLSSMFGMNSIIIIINEKILTFTNLDSDFQFSFSSTKNIWQNSTINMFKKITKFNNWRFLFYLQ